MTTVFTADQPALLDRLEGVKPTGDGQWETRCPAHADRVASLSVGLASDGTTLVKCHAGCSAADVVTAVGLTMADLFPQSGHNGRLDVVAEIARLKRVPLDSWKAFGEQEAKRGKLTVCRVPMYGPDLKVIGHQDFATIDTKWKKGVNGAKADGFRTG